MSHVPFFAEFPAIEETQTPTTQKAHHHTGYLHLLGTLPSSWRTASPPSGVAPRNTLPGSWRCRGFRGSLPRLRVASGLVDFAGKLGHEVLKDKSQWLPPVPLGEEQVKKKRTDSIFPMLLVCLRVEGQAPRQSHYLYSQSSFFPAR